MLGLVLGDPKVTVGLEVVGNPVVGLADGLPGLTVGPAVVIKLEVGIVVLGLPLGDPGVTVGPAVAKKIG